MSRSGGPGTTTHRPHPEQPPRPASASTARSALAAISALLSAPGGPRFRRPAAQAVAGRRSVAARLGLLSELGGHDCCALALRLPARVLAAGTGLARLVAAS
ncbi:MAG TPA: hypothetical protein VFS21_29655 [Roseiflexaceae bacterium]|nr:hypothetical protein [Roseiflexaceae bacterium]